MRRAIIGLPDGEVAADTDLASSYNERAAIDVERTNYLDGETIYHGTAAGTVTRTVDDVTIDTSSEEIRSERDERTELVEVTFYADLDAGFVGIDTSDGEFVWRLIGIKAQTSIRRAAIDLDRWAGEYERRDDATCWQLGYDRGDRVGVKYHDEATVADAARGGVSQLGFEYLWDTKPVRGTVTASGYVAVFTPMGVDEYARWLRDEVLPFAHLPDEDDQQTLDGGDDS